MEDSQSRGPVITITTFSGVKSPSPQLLRITKSPPFYSGVNESPPNFGPNHQQPEIFAPQLLTLTTTTTTSTTSTTAIGTELNRHGISVPNYAGGLEDTQTLQNGTMRDRSCLSEVTIDRYTIYYRPFVDSEFKK